ncbi:MAG: hypothetical protein GY832_26350 [Chloroflexi bacterium]|nr:hypothetical protein [Chloroflexota bacterium]
MQGIAPGVTQVAQSDIFGLLFIPKFGGRTWYVDAGVVASGNGWTPASAFLTIGEGIAAASAGDAISVKQGAYTEDNDLALDGLELWAEIGAIMIGTLTVSGNACRVRGLVVSPVGAVGIAVTGDYSIIEDTSVVGTPTTAFDIDGSYLGVQRCRAVGYTVTAYDVATPQVHLYRCVAQGADTATRGFYFSNAAADGCLVETCQSVGNTISGYATVTGVKDITFYYCSSGSEDGPKVDADDACAWPGYAFDDHLHKSVTLDGSGTYNLFQVTGVVRIDFIYAIVETATPANTTAASLQLFPAGGAAIQLTSLAGSNISSLPAGTMISKGQAAAAAIDVSDSTLGFVEEQVGFIFARFSVGQKTGGIATYIRLNVTEAAPLGGVLHFTCEWKPLSDDGNLVAV